MPDTVLVYMREQDISKSLPLYIKRWPMKKLTVCDGGIPRRQAGWKENYCFGVKDLSVHV